MNATMNRNGQQRKSLAGQLDRLDALLDGLADGLNEAVASAVQHAVTLAVQEAVRAVLTEVLQDHRLLAKLHVEQSVPTPPEPRTSTCKRWFSAGAQVIGRVFHGCRRAIADAVHAAAHAVSQVVEGTVRQARHAGTASQQRATRLLTGGYQLVRLARLFPGPLATGVAVAVVSGCVVYYASPWCGLVLGSLGGGVLSGLLHLTVRLRSWLPLLLAD
ncbi:MAG: hypothetical protein JNM56_02700 [Planctomycetia bacterium]|nr:hypothetical protein [Planctomycetia bacterium]